MDAKAANPPKEKLGGKERKGLVTYWVGKAKGLCLKAARSGTSGTGFGPGVDDEGVGDVL